MLHFEAAFTADGAGLSAQKPDGGLAMLGSSVTGPTILLGYVGPA